MINEQSSNSRFKEDHLEIINGQCINSRLKAILKLLDYCPENYRDEFATCLLSAEVKHKK